MPFGASVPLYIHRMTIVSTAPSTTEECGLSTELVGELGGSSTDVSMMIGVGLVKDSDAVYFQYMGEDRKPSALVKPSSGNPLTRIADVKLTGIAIAEDVGEFKSTKLNLFLTTSTGTTVMLTSGLTTIWAQCILTGLLDVFAKDQLHMSLSFDTWKGNSKMKPCFGAVRIGKQKMSDNGMYEALREARSDKDGLRIEELCRDAVAVIAHTINPQEAEVVIEEAPQVEGDYEQDEF